MILVNIDIMVMVLDSIHVHNLCVKLVVGVKRVFYGPNMSSIAYVQNNKKDVIIFCEDPTQGLDDTTLTVEYPIKLH